VTRKDDNQERQRVDLCGVKVKLFPDTFQESSWRSVSSSGRMFLATRKHHSKEEYMTAETKIAQGKMTLLQLAQRLRNVSEACEP
jgi:hypothetical protein